MIFFHLIHYYKTFLTNMAMPINSYWFRHGRLEKSGRKNPGILAVDDQYEFTLKFTLQRHMNSICK